MKSREIITACDTAPAVKWLLLFRDRNGQKDVARRDSDRLPLIPLSPGLSSDYDEPPKKPPLPVSRVPVSQMSFDESPILPAKSKNSPTDDAKGKPKDRCIYELDKLLSNLEGGAKSSKGNVAGGEKAGASNQADDDRMETDMAVSSEGNGGSKMPVPPYAQIDSGKKKIASTV